MCVYVCVCVCDLKSILASFFRDMVLRGGDLDSLMQRCEKEANISAGLAHIANSEIDITDINTKNTENNATNMTSNDRFIHNKNVAKRVNYGGDEVSFFNLIDTAFDKRRTGKDRENEDLELNQLKRMFIIEREFILKSY